MNNEYGTIVYSMFFLIIHVFSIVLSVCVCTHNFVHMWRAIIEPTVRVQKETQLTV